MKSDVHLDCGKLAPLPEPARSASDKCYLDTADKLYEGLDHLLKRYASSEVPRQKGFAKLWLTPSVKPEE